MAPTPTPQAPRGFRGWFAWLKPAHAALIALLLTLPSLVAGYGTDDYLMRCGLGARNLCPGPSTLAPPWDLFRFHDGSAALAHARREIGYAPWWSLDELRIWFFRPLASLTHAFDWFAFGDRAWAMHAHSVLWYGLLAFTAATFYRRMIGAGWVAGLAALLYAVDDAHGVPTGWLSNRNAFLATLFGLVAVGAYADWRERGSRGAAWLAPVALAASLLSAEAGVAAFVYMFAYALTLDRAPARNRVLALLPCAAIVVLWRLGWQAFGYGTFGGDFYRDPAREPLAFARSAAERVPLLFLGQFTISLVTDLWSAMPPPVRAAFWAAGLAVMAGAAWLFAPLLRRDPRARFFALSSLLSCPLVAGVIPTDRLMLFAGVGAHGLLALWLAEAADSPRRGARRGAAVLAALHLGLSGLLLPARTFTLYLVDQHATQAALAAPLGGLKPSETVVVLGMPYATVITFLPYQLATRGAPAPERLYTLVTGCTPAHLTRVDARTLRVRSEGGWSERSVLDRMYRGERFPMRAGERVELDAMQVEVLEVTPDGRPAEAIFRFRDPLEGGSYRWLIWGNDRLLEAAPPGEGETKTIHTPCPLTPI